jgi:hypothetical protein
MQAAALNVSPKFAASINLLPRVCLERLYMGHCFKHYLGELYRWRVDFATAEFLVYNEPEIPADKLQYVLPFVLVGTQSSISHTFKFCYQHFEGGDMKRVNGRTVKVGGTEWQDHPSLALFGDEMMERAQRQDMFELCAAPTEITPDVLPGGGGTRGPGEAGWIVLEEPEKDEKPRETQKSALRLHDEVPLLPLTPGGLVRVQPHLSGTTLSAAALTLFPERHYCLYNFAVDAHASGFAYALIENPFKVQGEEGEEKATEKTEIDSSTNTTTSTTTSNNSSPSNSNSATVTPNGPVFAHPPTPVFAGWPSPLPELPRDLLRRALEMALDNFYELLTDHREALRLLLESPFCPKDVRMEEPKKGVAEGEEIVVVGDCFQAVFEPMHAHHRILRIEPAGYVKENK